MRLYKTIMKRLVAGVAITVFSANSAYVFANAGHVTKMHELTLIQTQALLRQGTLSVAQLRDYYLQRIEQLDDNGPKLNAVVTFNQQLDQQVAALDKSSKIKHLLVLYLALWYYLKTI
ncbi:hypothetical protein P4S73_01000 [Paraglaciecola sp. Hal342]